jgi:hypothetical protein
MAGGRDTMVGTVRTKGEDKGFRDRGGTKGNIRRRKEWDKVKEQKYGTKIGQSDKDADI